MVDYRPSGGFGEVVEFYLSREEAEVALGEVLFDELIGSPSAIVPISFALSAQ